MALGVDTASALSNINWEAFYDWCGLYPVYAGRYFGSGYNWVQGEFAAAYSATRGVLNKIVPIQASQSARQQAAGSAGYSYGASDAGTTCQNIALAISAGQLSIPASGSVYVYLDVEQGTALSAGYWAGWSTTLFNYPLGAGSPFWPCIYTWYAQQSNGKCSPSILIQNALNSSCSSYPNHAALCYGLWSSEPELCSYCNFPKASPDWSVFNPFSQNTCSSNKPVPLLLYQFAEKGACNTSCGNNSFAGSQNLDLDSDNSGATGAQNYMLAIPAAPVAIHGE
jgi:hypothetical protein